MCIRDSLQLTMADSAQSGQRNIYHPTAYKPDNKKQYHQEYMDCLAFNPADVPIQAQASGKETVQATCSPHLGRRDYYGHRLDCGLKVDRIYDSLYPARIQTTFGATQSFKICLLYTSPSPRDS
eukprot:TRINITY_DN19058_c0_g1_i2.p1 TRINITY_DN19058_c0_g1~~TRINITY_DN19058_c0_g1_i2.p1  ORF type:complete len:124 (-),score=31.96 TRINITY_DN19058_c0_g1_i2:131-502(-)